MSIDQAKLEISKIFRQLKFIGRSFNLDIWTSTEHADNVEHDVTLMRAYCDLSLVRLELLAGAHILAEFKFAFAAGNGMRVFDTANGIELPLLDRSKVTGHRFLVQQAGKEATSTCSGWRGRQRTMCSAKAGLSTPLSTPQRSRAVDSRGPSLLEIRSGTAC